MNHPFDSDLQMEHERTGTEVNEKPDTMSTETPRPLVPMNNSYEGGDVVPPEVGTRYMPVVVEDPRRLQYDTMSISANITDAEVVDVLTKMVSAYINCVIAEHQLSVRARQIRGEVDYIAGDGKLYRLKFSDEVKNDLLAQVDQLRLSMISTHTKTFQSLVEFEQQAGFSGLFMGVMQDLKKNNYSVTEVIHVKTKDGKIAFDVTPASYSSSVNVGEQVGELITLSVVAVAITIVAISATVAIRAWAAKGSKLAQAEIENQKAQAAKLALVDKVIDSVVTGKISSAEGEKLIGNIKDVKTEGPGNAGGDGKTTLLVIGGVLVALGVVGYLMRGKIKSAARGAAMRAFA